MLYLQWAIKFLILKSKTLKSKDIPKELIEQYRVNLILKRELRKIKEKR